MASAGQEMKRKHKKNYYIQAAKKSRSGALEPGIKGILITCNSNEKQCVREAYNLLNEYADKLYGPESEAHNIQNTGDFEDDLANEINALKSKKVFRRFQQVNTMVKNVLFIKTTIPDPVHLVQLIYEDIAETKCRKTRYILKMTPVATTCKTSVNAYKTAINELIEIISKAENSSATYKVMCKVRHNNSISKDHIIWYCREAVEKYLPVWSPTLIDPENVISVDILQSVCCIGILKKYAVYKKYNLSEIVPHISGNSKACDDEQCEGLEEHSPVVQRVVKTESDNQSPGSISGNSLNRSPSKDCVGDEEVSASEATAQKLNLEQDQTCDINIFSSEK